MRIRPLRLEHLDMLLRKMVLNMFDSITTLFKCGFLVILGKSLK